MIMKKHITTIISWVLLISMLVIITPSLARRLEAEKTNKNVTVSLLANDLHKKVSAEKYDSMLDEYKQIGVDTVSVMEEDLNAFVSTGELTCIKYNVLLHKYDDESVYVGDVIAEKYPNVSMDSYVLLIKRDEMQERMRYQLPRRFSDRDYVFIGNVKFNEFTDDMDIYVFHDGTKQLWDFAVGYDESKIKQIHDKGMKVVLIHKVKNYANTEYLEDIDRLIKEYDIEFLNLKSDANPTIGLEENTANYEGIADIIINNNMTLAVTENMDQLSNQRFFGYNYVFDKVIKFGGTNKVVRAYETTDDSQSDETFYTHRTTQFFNSTMDRNIRFVTVAQLTVEKLTHDQLADYTFKATSEYIDRIKNEGFTINQAPVAFNYNVNKVFTYACCAVIMVIAIMIMLKLVFENEFPKLSVIAIAFSILAFAGTMLMPLSLASLLTLYPSVYCVVQSCFTMTLVLYFYKTMKDKMNVFLFTLSGLAITLASLLILSIGMGSMLSGIDYYINNDIFRGIKLSLIVPIVYTAVIFYIMFMKKKDSNILMDVYNLLNANIKVFWVIIGGAIAAVGVYYIIRSGNVESISTVEKTMRNTLTEFFSARPRTKEFLVGYPALILLAYYIKKTDIKLLQWLLAIAASILAASVTNSFCHVFTDYFVIVTRTINGLIVGICVSIAAIIANFILVKLAKHIYSKLSFESEMK